MLLMLLMAATRSGSAVRRARSDEMIPAGCER